MKNHKIKTKVVHSRRNAAWNVVSIVLGTKYKIARVPYPQAENQNESRQEAFEHAVFISFCFNNSEKICNMLKQNL